MPWSMPAIVLIIIGAANGPASSLAHVALNESLRRLVTPRATLSVRNIDIPPAPAAPTAADKETTDNPVKSDKDAADKDAADKAKAKDADVGDENTWRAKMLFARSALERDQLLSEAMQTRVNALVADFAGRDDPAQRAEIERQRIRALDELDRLKKLIQKDTEDIAAIEEDARKKGIPPGWIRF